MRLLELPAAMRDHGLEVVELAGWRERGRDFPRPPIGGVDHWTVGSSRGELPSAAVLTYGRSDLPGPLCNVARGRRVSGKPRAFMVAAGRANHAGRGAWRTSSGRTADSNDELFGLEVEYRPPHEAVRDDDLAVDAAIHAAAAEVCGYTAADVCGHYEYALPKGRKVDRRPVGGPPLRELVRRELERHRTPTQGDDDMAYATDGERKAFVTKAYERIAGRTPTAAERDPWVWALAQNPTVALDLIVELEREQRTVLERRIEALEKVGR